MTEWLQNLFDYLENMDKGSTVPKWVLINRPKCPQNIRPNLSAQALQSVVRDINLLISQQIFLFFFLYFFLFSKGMYNYLLVLNIFYALNGNINGGFVARSQISNVPFFREKHLRLTKTLEQNWLLKCGYVVCPFSTLYFVLCLVWQ